MAVKIINDILKPVVEGIFLCLICIFSWYIYLYLGGLHMLQLESCCNDFITGKFPSNQHFQFFYSVLSLSFICAVHHGPSTEWSLFHCASVHCLFTLFWWCLRCPVGSHLILWVPVLICHTNRAFAHSTFWFRDEIFTMFFSHVFWCYLVTDWHSIQHALDFFCILLFNYWLYHTTDGQFFLFYIIFIFYTFRIWIEHFADR